MPHKTLHLTETWELDSMPNKILEKAERVVLDHCDEYSEYLDKLLDLFKNESASTDLKRTILTELHSNEHIIDEIIAEDEENNSPLPLIKTLIDRMHNCSSELELKELLTKIVEEEFE